MKSIQTFTTEALLKVTDLLPPILLQLEYLIDVAAAVCTTHKPTRVATEK